ncbi:hypothetical protein [Crenobacter cavernae]|uniref:Uncharacterized protein n=1 Tax=Crenobacter cavernae TaxID=2290923 RepID=A0ABY0FDQ5_9NEIS|nr:hypothetical protein [Crenobacter cavernae]RXZ42588.1 hypothetical protein EBB06_11845 [Crenobacter cavernae]
METLNAYDLELIAKLEKWQYASKPALSDDDACTLAAMRSLPPDEPISDALYSRFLELATRYIRTLTVHGPKPPSASAP